MFDRSQAEIPIWTINGHEVDAADIKEGKLSFPDGYLERENAIYTAPANVPANNPIAIAVKFRPSKKSKEEVTLVSNITIVELSHDWYVAYTVGNYNYRSIVSPGHSGSDIYEQNAHATTSMIISNVAEANGHIIIDPSEDEGTINAYSSSGSWTENQVILKEELGKVVAKTVRKYSGIVRNEKKGIEFEYDPSPHGNKAINAGPSYELKGTDKYWVEDINGHGLKEDDGIGTSAGDIMMGDSNDKIIKTANGFEINNTSARDSLYSDALGNKFHEIHKQEYHVIIFFKKKRETKITIRTFGKTKITIGTFDRSKVAIDTIGRFEISIRTIGKLICVKKINKIIMKNESHQTSFSGIVFAIILFCTSINCFAQTADNSIRISGGEYGIGVTFVFAHISKIMDQVEYTAARSNGKTTVHLVSNK